MTQGEYMEWVQHPVTKEMTKALAATREGVLEELGAGATLSEFVERDTARLVGNIEGLDFFLNHQFEQGVDE